MSQNYENKQTDKITNLNEVAKMATEIIDNSPQYTRVHSGIDWSSLARLSEIVNFNHFTYVTLPKLNKYVLAQEEIKQELNNFKIAFDNIQMNPFYKQTELITQHITALVNFNTDITNLWTLKNVLETADIRSFDYQMTYCFQWMRTLLLSMWTPIYLHQVHFPEFNR